MLSRLATIGASSADISTQQVLVMFGASINMISGVLVLVYGFNNWLKVWWTNKNPGRTKKSGDITTKLQDIS